MPSFSPVTVTACGTFQFDGVNVRVVCDRLPCAGAELVSVMVTSADGWLFSTTRKVAVPPAEVVTSESVVLRKDGLVNPDARVPTAAPVVPLKVSTVPGERPTTSRLPAGSN